MVAVGPLVRFADYQGNYPTATITYNLNNSTYNGGTTYTTTLVQPSSMLYPDDAAFFKGTSTNKLYLYNTTAFKFNRIGDTTFKSNVGTGDFDVGFYGQSGFYRTYVPTANNNFYGYQQPPFISRTIAGNFIEFYAGMQTARSTLTGFEVTVEGGTVDSRYYGSTGHIQPIYIPNQDLVYNLPWLNLTEDLNGAGVTFSSDKGYLNINTDGTNKDFTINTPTHTVLASTNPNVVTTIPTNAVFQNASYVSLAGTSSVSVYSGDGNGTVLTKSVTCSGNTIYIGTNEAIPSVIGETIAAQSGDYVKTNMTLAPNHPTNPNGVVSGRITFTNRLVLLNNSVLRGFYNRANFYWIGDVLFFENDWVEGPNGYVGSNYDGLTIPVYNASLYSGSITPEQLATQCLRWNVPPNLATPPYYLGGTPVSLGTPIGKGFGIMVGDYRFNFNNTTPSITASFTDDPNAVEVPLDWIKATVKNFNGSTNFGDIQGCLIGARYLPEGATRTVSMGEWVRQTLGGTSYLRFPSVVANGLTMIGTNPGYAQQPVPLTVSCGGISTALTNRSYTLICANLSNNVTLPSGSYMTPYGGTGAGTVFGEGTVIYGDVTFKDVNTNIRGTIYGSGGKTITSSGTPRYNYQAFIPKNDTHTYWHPTYGDNTGISIGISQSTTLQVKLSLNGVITYANGAINTTPQPVMPLTWFSGIIKKSVTDYNAFNSKMIGGDFSDVKLGTFQLNDMWYNIVNGEAVSGTHHYVTRCRNDWETTDGNLATRTDGTQKYAFSEYYKTNELSLENTIKGITYAVDYNNYILTPPFSTYNTKFAYFRKGADATYGGYDYLNDAKFLAPIAQNRNINLLKS